MTHLEGVKGYDPREDVTTFDLRGIPYDRDWLTKALNKPCALGDRLGSEGLRPGSQDVES